MKDLFEKAKKEAFSKVNWKGFSPEFDNLSEQDIDSLLFKALIEYDLLCEQPEEFIDERYGGYSDSGVTMKGVQRYKRKIADFIVKYRDHCETDKNKYMEFN